MPTKTRSEKRKEQYSDFVKNLMNVLENKKAKKALQDLGNLMNEMGEYMVPGEDKTVTRDQLNDFMKRYVEIANKIADNQSINDEKELKKLQKIMGKDIKVFYEALSDSNAQSFNLAALFDQSRSIMINADSDNVTAIGGVTNTRLHIKSNDGEKEIDGFFTEHVKPFDEAEEKMAVIDQVAEGDEDIRKFLSYLFTLKQRNSEFLIQYATDQKVYDGYNMAVSVDKIGARMLYPDDKAFLEKYTKALKDSADRYFSNEFINRNSPEGQKIMNFIDKFTGPDAAEKMDKLVGLAHTHFLVDNKNSTLEVTGINKKSRIDKRNSAMYTFADMIGSKVIAPAHNMRVNMDGKIIKGTFMKTADGVDPNSAYDNEDILKVTNDSLEDSPELLRDCSDLMIIDYIMGNVDRHSNNFFLKLKKDPETGKVKVVGLQGIDNDTSCGTMTDRNAKKVLAFVDLNDIRIISRKTAEKVMALNPNTFRAMLAGFDLTKKEIDSAVKRLNEVKAAISNSRNLYQYKNKGEIIPNPQVPVLKIVDDDEFKYLSIKEHLNNKNRSSNGHSNLYTRLSNDAKNGIYYLNAIDKSTVILADSLKDVRNHVRNNIKDFEALHLEVVLAKNNNKDTEEYKNLVSAIEKFKTTLGQIGTKVDPFNTAPTRENVNKLKAATSEALFLATDYMTLIQDRIRLKEDTKKPVSKEERDHLESIRKCIDGLEDLHEKYGKFFTQLEKQDELISKKNEHVAKTMVELHAYKVDTPNRIEMPDSIEKLEADIKSDKIMTNAELADIRNNVKNPGKYTNVIIIEAINNDSREQYLKLMKDNMKAPGEKGLDENEKKALAEKIYANTVLKRICVSQKAIAETVARDPKLYDVLSEKMINHIRTQKNYDEGINKILDKISKDCECAKKAEEIKKSAEINGMNSITPEQEKVLEGVKHLNLLMKNGAGTSAEDKEFIKTYGNITRKIHNELIDVIQKSLNELSNAKQPKPHAL